MQTTPIFTIGHSNHPLEAFFQLLERAKVTAIADVRSFPYSQHASHFNKEDLQRELKKRGIQYSFLGEELGGRPKQRAFFDNGVANYEAMAQSAFFCSGLDRVIDGAKKYRIALMCSEREPLDCHRCLLVGRQLVAKGLSVAHILSDGKVESHGQTEQRLLSLERRETDDLFLPEGERLAIAYRERAKKAAFSENDKNQEKLRKAAG